LQLKLFGELVILQAPIFDGLPFDRFALLSVDQRSAVVGVCRGPFDRVFLVNLVIVVCDIAPYIELTHTSS
jgi:hypothetical protein